MDKKSRLEFNFLADNFFSIGWLFLTTQLVMRMLQGGSYAEAEKSACWKPALIRTVRIFYNFLIKHVLIF